MRTFSLAVSAALLAAPMAYAQMDHGSMDHSNMAMSDAMIEGAVHTAATVNSIDDGTANVSHDPIPEIGWPAMTMDLPLASDAQMMGEIAPGDAVTLMLVKDENGMYVIGAMMAE